MRIIFNSDRRPKRVAKLLKKHAEAIGTPVKLGRAQQITAQIFGYRDWHEMRAFIGSRPPSDSDDDVGPAEAELRRQFQAAVLVSALGVDTTVADSLIDKLAPPRHRRSAASGEALLSDDESPPSQQPQATSSRPEVVVVVKKARRLRHVPGTSVRVFNFTASRFREDDDLVLSATGGRSMHVAVASGGPSWKPGA